MPNRRTILKALPFFPLAVASAAEAQSRPTGKRIAGLLVNQDAMPFLEKSADALSRHVRLSGKCSDQNSMWWEVTSKEPRSQTSIGLAAMIADAVFGNSDSRVSVDEAKWLLGAYESDAMNMECGTNIIQSPTYNEPLLKIAGKIIATDALIPLFYYSNALPHFKSEKPEIDPLYALCDPAWVVNYKDEFYNNIPHLASLEEAVKSSKTFDNAKVITAEMIDDQLKYLGRKEIEKRVAEDPELGKACEESDSRIRKAGKSFRKGIEILAGVEDSEKGAGDDIVMMRWPKSIDLSYKDIKINILAEALSVVLPFRTRAENGVYIDPKLRKMILDIGSEMPTNDINLEVLSRNYAIAGDGSSITFSTESPHVEREDMKNITKREAAYVLRNDIGGF